MGMVIRPRKIYFKRRVGNMNSNGARLTLLGPMTMMNMVLILPAASVNTMDSGESLGGVMMGGGTNGGKNWFWDPYQYRYVWTWGSRSWSTDSWPEATESPETPSTSPEATVHSKLAARLPTQPDLGTPARTEASEASDAKPGQEQDATNHVESDDDEGAESWRRDKYGNALNPNALYMRFYRRLRSILICT